MTSARSKADRRAEILSAARKVLAQKGFHETNVSDIVAKAGVSQGTFYLYFSSKASLISALNAELLNGILVGVREAASEAESFAEAISSGVAAVFRETERYRDVLAVIHIGVGLQDTPADWDHMREPYYELVAEAIRQGQSAGEADPALHPMRTAHLVVGLVEHAAEDCYMYDTKTPPETYIAETTKFVRRALGA